LRLSLPIPPTGAAFSPAAYRGGDFPYSAAAFNGDFDSSDVDRLKATIDHGGVAKHFNLEAELNRHGAEMVLFEVAV
jgi:hypothetical protein